MKRTNLPLRHTGFPTIEQWTTILQSSQKFDTLAKLPKTLQTLFSLNSNFDIRGSSAKAPPIHCGRVRLLALT
ncbi:hypothetical protein DVH24_010647 [Malus domestica]|uniref:Uncharacterized protein n=1 Tax=Malus domestica TaxID=3750 RepID=A0A498JXW5_MALDO|nr:hypothetical protein DVH24_010647 [Malus domestica]